MGENRQGSRVGFRGGNTTVGEIVEVEGGHIVRSTGRKDRHSKVCTAKGPRDRRVRLSAHTAIQFYDVQDRLGYDRPSKAVDWLIKKAKPAIDELAEIPAWQPTYQSEPDQEEQEQTPFQNQQQQVQKQTESSKEPAGSSKRVATEHGVPCSSFDFQHQNQNQNQNQNPHLNQSSNFLPPSLDSDAIADTIKSFFPMGSSSTIQFQNYPPDLLSRTNSQDLRLSLQSFQDPILLHDPEASALTHHRFSGNNPTSTGEQALFFAGDAAGTAVTWSEQQREFGRFQKLVSWNNNADPGGFQFHVFNPPQIAQNPFFTQRGPLQSSYSPHVRARVPAGNQPVTAGNVADHHGFTPSVPAGFASGGFSGFRIPARIQGEEEQEAVLNKQSSASSASRH